MCLWRGKGGRGAGATSTSLKFDLFLLSPYFIEIPVFSANSVDPDQTSRSAASDLGLHCLLMPLVSC